ncbi:MAG: hydrogenase maturation protease [Gammaproteobacteria bacterium]
MTDKGVLVAGIGNVFLGDDAFGVEVAQRLSQRQLPQGVRVADFGIRGMDLSYALLDGFDQAILVDTRQQGGPPGTLYVIEPELEDKADDADPQDLLISPHDMDPGKVLRIVKAMGGAAAVSCW